MKPGPKKLSPFKGKRRKIIDAMLNPENVECSTIELCRIAGISKESYYKYTKEQNFIDVILDLSIKTYARHLPQVVNRLVMDAKKGDSKASRLIHEALQLAGNKNTQTVNIANQAIPVEDIVVNTPEELALLLRDKIQELQAMLAQVTGMRIETAAGMITAGENATPCHTPPDEPAKAGE